VWNKRTDEQYPATARPEQPVREPMPMQPGPAPAAQPSRAIIGPSMHIKGEIRSSEELYIDGEVDGTLELRNSLTIGPRGKVHANIKAREVTILGSVRGNVEVAEKIAIRHNGSLIGDIKTAGISIDDGAYFKGSIDIIRPEPSRLKAAAGMEPGPAPVRQEQTSVAS